jgi:hypothetical protein
MRTYRLPLPLLVVTLSAVAQVDSASTDGQQRLFTERSAKLQEQLVVWDKVLSQDLTGLTQAAEKQNIKLADVCVRK